VERYFRGAFYELLIILGRWKGGRTSGAEAPELIWRLRGAEAPLFHVTARLCEFFRSLWSRALPGIIDLDD